MMLLRFSIVILLVVCWPLMASENDDSFYLRFENEQQIVDDTLAQAKQNNQLVAVILGANWCHDSRALAGFFDDPAMAQVTESMTVLPLDVGYLENKQSLLSQFDYPAYFATPTLLLIDPDSKQVINRASLPAWQSAHNESVETLQSYLQTQQQQWREQWQPDVTAPAVAEFEAQQASILYNHYQQLGALLALEDNNQPAPGLDEQWRAVKQYRMALQSDLIHMHQQGKMSDEMPNYSPIAW